MLQIAPSILAADFSALGADCSRILAAGADCLHFDVMDGTFVPNISVGLPVLNGLAKAVPAVYDVHLMIQRPAEYVQRFADAGADWITFHVEADGDPETILDAIHAAGKKAGVSVRPGTPAEAVFPLLPKLDLVLVMSVEPGFGGQKFMPAALGKIRALRAEALRTGCTGVQIEVDGGINDVTGAQCAAAGADILVAGSALFGAADPAAAVRSLRAACAAARCEAAQ